MEGSRMNLMSLLTDNITEILIKIVKFTRTRQKILVQNIINVQDPGFIPKELEVDEFSDVLNYAIDEHVRNRRLVLRDTENIKFGASGSIELKPIIDEHGIKLLEENREEYIERQINKLWENALNQKLAAELLRQKQGTITIDS
jgi:flagellar basal body rod protein FlgB